MFHFIIYRDLSVKMLSYNKYKDVVQHGVAPTVDNREGYSLVHKLVHFQLYSLRTTTIICVVHVFLRFNTPITQKYFNYAPY